jgi:hypothetical protein
MVVTLDIARRLGRRTTNTAVVDHVAKANFDNESSHDEDPSAE